MRIFSELTKPAGRIKVHTIERAILTFQRGADGAVVIPAGTDSGGHQMYVRLTQTDIDMIAAAMTDARLETLEWQRGRVES